MSLQTETLPIQRALQFLIAALIVGLSQSEESAAVCRFGAVEYQVGQSWHPRLETQGTVFCVTCRCYEGGRLNCTSKECPVSCTGEGDSSECCRICAETHGSNLQPVTPEVMACIHNGHLYKDGERFYPNISLLADTKPNQCVQCVCQDGLVLCEDQLCHQLSCKEPISLPDQCCPQCPGGAENKDESSTVSFRNPTVFQSNHNKDCISAGRYYLDGSTWHPVMGPFGAMACVLCKCNSGTIECSRFQCPDTFPCSKPVRQFGQCCPTCSLSVMAAVQGDEDEEEVSDTGSVQCVPKMSDFVVYKAQGAGNLSEFLQYAFQQVDGEAELHSWVTRSGAVMSFQIQTITANDFTDLRHKFQFHTIGSTSPKQISKFTRREKKLKRRCKVNCSSRVRELEQALNLVKITTRSSCHASETELPPA